MAIKLRGDTWWLDVQINGQRIRESLKTSDKREAQKAHDIRRGELWRVNVLKEKPNKTLGEAFDRWLLEKSHKRSIETDRLRIEILRPKIGSMKLANVTRSIVERHTTGAAAATRNRYRALMRAILRAAERDWEWIDKAPIIKAEVENNERKTFITREQADRLIAELPEHYRPAVRFALLTGLRKANVLGLRWAAVNLEAGTVVVAAEEAKGKRKIIVPLNASAKALLEEIRHCGGSNPALTGSVFGLRTITEAAWKRACERAGITDFRFHDLRHTWASWHAMAGTPAQVLQELGGWQSYSMVERYVTFAPSHLAAAAEAVSL
jgi:integrase